MTRLFRWLFVGALFVALATVAAASAGGKARGLIAFERDVGTTAWVYVMNADGSGQTQLFAGRDPSWSPDGQQLAFWGGAGIKTANVDGSGVRTLTTTFSYTPSWSPRGDRIAFTDQRAGSDDIWVMAADGSGQTRLTDNPLGDYFPTWSPDGSRIAYAAASPTGTGIGNFDIWVMNADGSAKSRLTTDSAADITPGWSPDGKRIAFVSYRIAGNAEIFVMNADGSNQTRLTFALASYDVLPAWSPDGTKVAFMSNRDGNEEIYVIDVASGVEANLTNAPLYGDSYPDWQPSPIDSTPPVLTVPETISMNATSPAGTQIPFTVTATDDLDPNPTVSCTPPSGSTFQIGTTTVNCTATDASGNSANASFTVHVKGAAEQLADLGDAVKGVGPGKSLAVKVGIAEMFVAHGMNRAACLTLIAFNLEVRALSGKKIPPAQATTLIADATRIKTVLGC